MRPSNDHQGIAVEAEIRVRPSVADPNSHGTRPERSIQGAPPATQRAHQGQSYDGPLPRRAAYRPAPKASAAAAIPMNVPHSKGFDDRHPLR